MTDYAGIINRLESDIDEIRVRINHVKQKWIEEECPVKVGDIVKVNGYAHKGKKVKLEMVWVFERHNNKFCFKAKGRIIKADGELGVAVGEWWSDRT